MRTKQKSEDYLQRERTGPRSAYRPKGKPTTIALTALGEQILRQHAKRNHYSLSDVVEYLLRASSAAPFSKEL
jgi:hypothetical protein